MIVKTSNIMVGSTFGKWTVIDSASKARWVCKCECGTIKTIRNATLKHGLTKQCKACFGISRRAPSLLGKVFGKWTVIGHEMKNSASLWKCLCVCGNISYHESTNLRKRKTSSCAVCGVRRLPPGQSAYNELWGEYKRNARKRSLQWELTNEEFRKLTSSHCFYTGLPPSSVRKSTTGEYVYNGIDRLDNSKGYTIDNCVPCAGRVNEMKMGANYSDFINMCCLIADHCKNKSMNEVINQLKAV